MKLRQYILNNYDGNNSAFGRANDMSRAVVNQMVKAGKHFVFAGKIYLLKKEVK
jgi:hypothetical protein